METSLALICDLGYRVPEKDAVEFVEYTKLVEPDPSSDIEEEDKEKDYYNSDIEEGEKLDEKLEVFSNVEDFPELTPDEWQELYEKEELFEDYCFDLLKAKGKYSEEQQYWLSIFESKRRNYYKKQIKSKTCIYPQKIWMIFFYFGEKKHNLRSLDDRFFEDDLDPKDYNYDEDKIITEYVLVDKVFRSKRLYAFLKVLRIIYGYELRIEDESDRPIFDSERVDGNLQRVFLSEEKQNDYTDENLGYYNYLDCAIIDAIETGYTSGVDCKFNGEFARQQLRIMARLGVSSYRLCQYLRYGYKFTEDGINRARVFVASACTLLYKSRHCRLGEWTGKKNSKISKVIHYDSGTRFTYNAIEQSKSNFNLHVNDSPKSTLKRRNNCTDNTSKTITLQKKVSFKDSLEWIKHFSKDDRPRSISKEELVVVVFNETS